MLQVSSIVAARPHLLENFIRAQFTGVLQDADCEEYTKDDRAEAFAHVEQLARLRHESAADTLRDILE